MAQKSFHRTDRVSAQLRRELGKIVHQTVREHGLPSLSVSDVEVTRDLAHAKVFVTFMERDSETDASAALAVLNHAAGFLQFRLQRKCDIAVRTISQDEVVTGFGQYFGNRFADTLGAAGYQHIFNH